MSVLYIRDDSGKFQSVNTIRGDNGKSAYEYAQEGGYTGTEEEFAKKLATGFSDSGSSAVGITGIKITEV